MAHDNGMRLDIRCLLIHSFIEDVGIKALDNFILPTQGIDEVVVRAHAN